MQTAVCKSFTMLLKCVSSGIFFSSIVPSCACTFGHKCNAHVFALHSFMLSVWQVLEFLVLKSVQTLVFFQRLSRYCVYYRTSISMLNYTATRAIICGGGASDTLICRREFKPSQPCPWDLRTQMHSSTFTNWQKARTSKQRNRTKLSESSLIIRLT